MTEQEKLADDLLALTHETFRHLVKQDTLENASFFDEYMGYDSRWNNDTVVLALELIVQKWMLSNWNIVYEAYASTGPGLAPANADILEALGLKEQYHDQGQEVQNDEQHSQD